MLDQLEDAHEQGHLACYSEDLFNTSVWQDKTFYDLYSPDSPIPIPRDVQERIGSIFCGLPKWQDLESEWPPSFEIQVDGAPKEVAPSIAWAHKQTSPKSAHSVACLVFSGGRKSGCLLVDIDSQKTNLWFVANSQDYCDFFRWLIVETTDKPSEMERFAPSAFPSLYFVDGVFNGIKGMSKPYRDLVRPLVHHLGTFSDHGRRIFEGPRDQVAAEFGALGVDISDENGNTKSNHDARVERTINVEGIDTIFWWHSKLEPHQDRIHINPEKIATGGQLLVGIFCRHLTT